MIDNYTEIKYDEDYKIFDVFLIVQENEYWMKGFDEDEFNLAEEFAIKLADNLQIEYS